jgi:hypothetical protein
MDKLFIIFVVDQEKKRKISLSTSQFTQGENKPQISEPEKGEANLSPFRPQF